MVGLYILLGSCDSSNMALFLFLGSVIAYVFARYGFNLLATHVLICSGFAFQFSVTYFTRNTTFSAFLSTLPIAVSIFTLPDSLAHMTIWYIITSSAGFYLFFVHNTSGQIPYLIETEDDQKHRVKIEFVAFQTLQLAALTFGLFLYTRVQGYVKRTSAIMMEIETARHEAEAGVRAKDFLATMSHEIRTPLHGVLGMAQILNSSQLSSEQHEYVGEIIVLGNNLISMVTNILDLSRVEADLYVLEPHSTNVEMLCTRLMCIVMRALPAKSIKMTCVISAGVPRHVILDSKRVLGILYPILASNFNGHFTVTLRAEHTASSHALIINISNTDNRLAQTWQAIISAYTSSASSTTTKGVVKTFRRRPSLLASTLSLLQAVSSRYKTNNTTSSSDHAGLSVALCLRILTLMNGEMSIDPRLPDDIRLSIPYFPDATLSDKYEKEEVITSCPCDDLAEHEHDPHEYEQAQLRYHVATCPVLINNVSSHVDSPSTTLPILPPPSLPINANTEPDEFMLFETLSGQYRYRWLMCIVCIFLMIFFAGCTYYLDGPQTLFYGALVQIIVTSIGTLLMRSYPKFAIHLIMVVAAATQQGAALYYDNHILRTWSAIHPYIVSIFTVPNFEVPLVSYTISLLVLNAVMYLWYDVRYPPANFVGTKEQLWDRVVMDCFVLELIVSSFAAFAYFSLRGITHLKQNIDAYMETLISSKRAAEAGRRASTFLSIVSHNIRTPLHSLLGATQLLANMDMSPDQHDCVLQIQSCGNILMSLVTNVLNSTQMDTGMFVFEEHSLQIQETLQSTLDVLSVLATQKGIQLSGTIQPGVPKFMMGDPKYLLQILLNITGNAVKFTSKGHVRIEIKIETPTDISCSSNGSNISPPPPSSIYSAIPRNKLNSSSLSPPPSPSHSPPSSSPSHSPPSPSPSHSPPSRVSRRLLILVHDTGPGMEEAVKAQLFQPYIQGDQSHSRSQSGSGLGLAICNRLATIMQGNIGMSSSVGRGSSFWVAIPLTRGTEDETEFTSPVYLHNIPARPVVLPNNNIKNDNTNNNDDNISHSNNENNNRSVRNRIKPSEVMPTTTTPIKILVVDDNALNLKVATRALSRIKSAQIDVATNGAEAIEKITNGSGKLSGPVPYTTIFMDVQMPVMDGIEATQKIRKLEAGYPPVYIVGLSAHAEMEIKRCLDAGMNQFIGKPFPMDDLIGAVLKPRSQPLRAKTD